MPELEPMTARVERLSISRSYHPKGCKNAVDWLGFFDLLSSSARLSPPMSWPRAAVYAPRPLPAGPALAVR